MTPATPETKQHKSCLTIEDILKEGRSLPDITQPGTTLRDIRKMLAFNRKSSRTFERITAKP